MTEPKPMDPERLAALRELAASFPAGAAGGFLVDGLIGLLADRDYQAARADAAEQGEPSSFRLDTLRRLAKLPPDAAWSTCMITLKRVERHRDAARAALAESEADLSYAIEQSAASTRERDEARAELARLRARVQVDRDDVTRSGVTRAHVISFLRENGWIQSPSEGSWGHEWGASELWRPALYDGRGVSVYAKDDQDPVADAIRTIAYHFGKCGLDILDEMAAMPLGEVQS